MKKFEKFQIAVALHVKRSLSSFKMIYSRTGASEANLKWGGHIQNEFFQDVNDRAF